MATNDFILRAALSGLAAGIAQVSHQALAEDTKPPQSVECYGINSRKGQNGCSVDAEHVKAAKEVLGAQYAKSKVISCAGNSDCGAKGGNLAWIKKPSAADCFKEGGMVFEKVDNKLIIKNKDGNVKKG